MAPPVSPLWRLAAVISALAAASVALEVGLTDQRDSPKRSRSLLQEEVAGDRIKKRMIDTPVELCDGCPPIYGWTQQGAGDEGGVAELSINVGASRSSSPVDDPAPTWVVVMNKLAGCDPGRLCEEAAATGKGRFSGECSETYGTVIRGMAIRMDLPNMAAFSESAKECVQEVWRDARVSIQATQRSPPWGLDRIDQAELPLSDSYTFTAHGTGVNAYIIDTGIMASHHQFQYQDGSPGTRVRNTYSGFEDNDATDCHGHGTHVAATLGGLTFGVAKNVTLHAIRVLDCQGNAQYSRVIKALDHLANTHLSPAVAVLSLGGEPYNALDIAVQAMVESGISVSVAAGNDKRDACLQSPARVRSVITVAGTTSSDTMYWNSNFGKCVDLFAPGVNILSAVHTSNTATGYMTGTSMSAPFVAGAAALFLERNPEALPYSVKHALVTSAATGVVVNTRGAPNKMLSTKVFAPVMFNPPEFRITDESPSASYWVSVTLAKRPASTVRMDVDRDSMSHGTMQITSLVFEPSNWNLPQYFVFEPSDSSPRGESFNIEFDIESSDPEFSDLETFFQVTDDREKLGETKEYPVQIASLPFEDSRDTRQYTHVYNHDCSEWGDTGDGPDVVYKYRPESDVILDINLCESDYDSKVYLYRNDEEEAYACNDDRCGYQSRLRVKLTAGDDFYIIIDGYSGDSGKFILEIRAISGIDPLKIPAGEVDEAVNPLPDLDDAESSNDVEMVALSLTNCELSPAFSPAKTSYACRIPPGAPELTVTYVTADLLSVVEVSNDSLRRRSSRRLSQDLSVDAASYKRLELRQGLNIVRLVVLSPDFQRERAYQIEVTLLSDIRETWLKSLQFYNGAHDGPILPMAPSFAFDRMDYVLSVPGKGDADLWVETEPLSTNSRVTVAVEGKRLKGDSSSVLSGAIALRRRSDIAVVVTAPDGETVSSYQIQIRPEFEEAPAPGLDCKASGFGDWEQCSRECGGGVQLRRRTIQVPASGSGAPCGPMVQEQPCNEQPCQTDCSVSPYGDWSGCSARCGAGVQTRTRYVLDVPTGGGVTCPALMEEQFCEVPPELCYQDTDCVLGPWGDWGECSALCSGGTQTRSRLIEVPKVGNGRSCSVTEESRRCNVQDCSSQCEVTSWGRWEACDSACGPGIQYRRRTVVGMPSDGSSSGCPLLSESRPCETSPCSQGQDPYPEGASPPIDLLGPGATEPSWSLDSIEDAQTMDAGAPLPEAAAVPRYRWVIYGFDACSSSCGGGTQQRTVQCARINGGGWEIESPGVCEDEGAGKMPATSRACNLQGCAHPAPMASPWKSCSASCDGGIQERAVSCRGTLGMLLPRSSCLDRQASTWQTCAPEPCSSAGRPTWVLGPWDKCPVSCGGGVMSRGAQCMDRAAALRLGAEMEEVPAELCGVLGRDQPLEAPCNSRPCRVGVWKVGQWDEGSCGSSCASPGVQRTRPVTCVALDGDRQEQIDDRECLLSGAPKPASTAPCGSDCTGCGPSGDCFGNGACEAVGGRGGSVCSCSPGFSGEFCEVPASCLSGVIDAQIRCCPGAVDATTGACCSAGSVTDSRGACCSSGSVDACGVCDGPSISVDVTGTCCPSVLDAAGLCCLSGALDECGTCDGDGSTCDTLLDLMFSLDGVLDANAVLRQSTGARAQVKSFVSQQLIPSNLDGRQEGTVAVERLYSYYTGQDLGINSDAAAGPGMAGGPMHGVVVNGDSVDPSAGKPPALPQQPPKPRRRLHQQQQEEVGDEGALDMQQESRAMVAVTDAWLENDQELMSATVSVSGLLQGEGSPITAARAASVLEEQVSLRPTQQASGTLELVGISFVERRGVCGNGYCEVGERPLAAGPFTAALRDGYGDALNPCPADCPVELHACPSPTDSADPTAMCGGAGKCLHGSGVCECFLGHTGDDCGSCSPGFYRTPTGRCTPTATRLAGASITISGPMSKAMDKTMVLFVSIGAVIIGVCIGIIAAALIYLHCKRRRASDASGARQQQKHAAAAQQQPPLQQPYLQSGVTPPVQSGCKRPRSPMSTPQSTVGVLHGAAEVLSPGFSTPAATVRHHQQSSFQQEDDDMSYYVCPPTMMTQSEGGGTGSLHRSLSYENSNEV